MALPLRRVLAKRKIVPCTQCGEWMEVAAKAMSVFCPKCRKRVILENYRITGYHAVRNLQTCGDVEVTKGATLSASTKAANVTIRGTFWGDAEVLEKMEIAKSGHVRGSVRASRLVVKGGATIEGYCEIGVMKLPAPPATSTDRSAGR